MSRSPLSQCRPTSSTAPPPPTRLRSYDAAHDTAYADTLLAYLNANSDTTAAARRLSVHPNTCRYRLARAEQICGFSLADPDERLLLWLQLRFSDPPRPVNYPGICVDKQNG